MQAIILAAGMGKRLKELTQNNTKCMVKVNGVTLIDRMLHQIDRQNVSRIVIVVGYEGDKLIPDSAKLKIHPLRKMPKIWYNKGIRIAEKQHQKGEEENAENRDSNKR